MNYASFTFTFKRICIIIVPAISVEIAANLRHCNDTCINDNEEKLCCNLKN